MALPQSGRQFSARGSEMESQRWEMVLRYDRCNPVTNSSSRVPAYLADAVQGCGSLPWQFKASLQSVATTGKYGDPVKCATQRITCCCGRAIIDHECRSRGCPTSRRFCDKWAADRCGSRPG